MNEDQEKSGPALTPEAAIRAAHIGEPPVHNRAIYLAPYDTKWPRLFEREAQRIRGALGDRALLIEHVGSTSVPGLSAKPIIDILLVVPDSADEPAYVPALEAAGYTLHVREPHWHQHRLFKGPDTNINLHVFSPGSGEIERMVLFRDHLRTHEDDKLLYERTKQELAAREWKYVQHYADSKGSVVEDIVERAQRGSAD